MPTTFSEIVDHVRQLDPESKHELLRLLRQWVVEERREEILRHAEEAETEHAHGRAKTGSVDELIADLYAED